MLHADLPLWSGTVRYRYSEFLAATLDRRFYLQIDRIRDAFQR